MANIVGHCTKHTEEAAEFVGRCMCEGFPNCGDIGVPSLRPESCPSKFFRIKVGWQGTLPDNVKMYKLYPPAPESYGSGFARSLEPMDEKFSVPLVYNEKDTFIFEFHDVYVGGEGGLIFDDCHYYTGGHRGDAPLGALTEAARAGNPVVPIHVATGTIISQTHNNYYHFLIEGMSRLVLLLRHSSPQVRVLVPEENRFTAELVSLFDLEDRLLVYRPELGRYQFDMLYYPDWERVDAPRTDYYQYDPWAAYQPSRFALRLLQEMMWEKVDALAPMLASDPDVVVVVSRRDVNSRNLIGEDRLLSALRKHFAQADVVLFVGTDHTILEQARLFRRAILVVGGHGASLANIVFCKPNTPVVLHPLKPNVDQNFAHLCSAMDLQLYVVPSVSAAFHQNYTLTSESLSAVMRTVREATGNQSPATHDHDEV
eukprot:TRINITY_DN6476_c0_g1_i3.p1 TRINITY_DN6476_c0_g1~~TRINITY_DN6476_c0_g1_i3.p1  ORF type:complete len:428 (+),score=90.26 TRINITY_DN6476_c0_g1_i3:125-1408(+)